MEAAEPPCSPSSSGAAAELLHLLRSGEMQESFFSRLLTYYVELVGFLENRRREAPDLFDMAEFIRRAPSGLRQYIFDCTSGPLLSLLGEAIESRSHQTVESQGSPRPDNASVKKHRISDTVAEGAVSCLKELLQKCHLTSVKEMAMVLETLTSGASLSPSAAAEEFRGGVIECIQSMLLLLKPCSSESCKCKQTATACTFSSILQDHVTAASNSQSKSEECLLAFLQSPSASVAVAHLFSVLLKAARTEAARGLRGSAKLRKEAFLTVRVLIAKVGNADTLAFPLPGIVSHLSEALYVRNHMISGAAGNVACIDHAIRGLSEILVIVLRNEININEPTAVNDTEVCFEKATSSDSVLEALRQLGVHEYPEESLAKPLVGPSVHLDQPAMNINSEQSKSFHVERTKIWVDETSLRVNNKLSDIFPDLCKHPSEKVRHALVYSIQGLLGNCWITLNRSKLMLLECLCVLVCDDSETVSVDAQDALESLLMVEEKYFRETELAGMLNRLVEMLPRIVIGNEETSAVAHVQKLLALMYYAGPKFVADHLLHPPTRAAQILELLGSSLSQSSLYSGSIGKLILAKPLSIGYLHSIAELKSASLSEHSDYGVTFVSPSIVPKISEVAAYNNYELPRMPPWFLNLGNEKLYIVLAQILRLLGSAATAEHRNDVSLALVIDGPIEMFRKLISEIRLKGYSQENWHSWYYRSSSGQLVRQTSTAACVLNEIIYGTSDKSREQYPKIFGKSKMKIMKSQKDQIMHEVDRSHSYLGKREFAWKASQDSEEQVIQCVGIILHEYLSSEVWDLPVAQNSNEIEALSSHFLRDVVMLHQVIVEGIGIFNISLGRHFIQSGFMHSSLFLLLQKLICSSNQIRSTSDAVLHVISTASGYSTVGDFIASNADYIIDSLSRQLRHLDLNPHIPDVLAVVLSYIGVVHEILPLLEEPMKSISRELEVLSRSQHPAFTHSFLKAIGEIMKASKREASVVTSEAASFYSDVKCKICNSGKHEMESCSPNTVFNISSFEAGKTNSNPGKESKLEFLEELLLRLNEMKRYRCIVGSITESCLKSAIPLLASAKETNCLAALDIVEDAIMALEKVEDGYKHEKETKEAIAREIELISCQELLDMPEEGTEENRLLPAMNKIWPYLIICVKNRTSVAVIRRCMSVFSTAVQICGGDFFIRRFRVDGPAIWRLLATSVQRGPQPSKAERPLLLPYRKSVSSEDSLSEVSNLRVQEAVLNMVAEVAANKRSSSAMEAVLKKVSGLVVGIACASGTNNLREACLKALSGLACIDADLIWLLLADVYHSLKPKESIPPPTSDFASISSLLPSPSSAKEYLYVQYGGEVSAFNLDPSAAETVYKSMFPVN